MAELSKDPTSIAQLRRFLYLGDESKPYPFSISVPFKSENIQSIFDACTSADSVHEVIRVYRDGHYLGVEPVMYALAVFAHSENKEVKQAAWKAAKDMFLNATEIFTFSYMYTELCKPAKGWGRSHRSLWCQWYNRKEPRDLAVEVTKVPSYHMWTHKDMICMSHVKAEKDGSAAVLAFLHKGYEVAEKDFSSKEDANAVLKFLQAINEIRHTADGEIAARLIETHDLCLEQIPTRFLKTKEVSLCLIPRVPIKNLLKLIPLFCRLGLLKLNSPHYKALLERLNTEEALTDGSIDTVESFLAIRKWQISNRITPGKSLVRQNTPAIDDSLQNLHLSSFKLVIPTQKRYLIAVDIRPSMSQSACEACKSVTPSNVSDIILLTLVKADLSNVTVLVFSPDELVLVDINNKMTISDVNEHITKVVPGPVNLSAPLQWALMKKKAYDLFLVFTDRFINVDSMGCQAALKEYKDTLSLPNTRYIISFLCDEKATSFADDPDILNIVGFNIKLLKIIQDFACGIF